MEEAANCVGKDVSGFRLNSMRRLRDNCVSLWDRCALPRDNYVPINDVSIPLTYIEPIKNLYI